MNEAALAELNKSWAQKLAEADESHQREEKKKREEKEARESGRP
jgi:hypothetical protein